MRRSTWWIIACGLGAWQAWGSVPSMAHAAEELATEPEGTYMVLSGPISVAGRAPIPLEELPEGEYQLQTEGRGEPTVRGRLTRDGAGIRIRSWAGPGAVLAPPGLIHLLREERRGWIFLGGATASAALALSAHGDFRDAEDELDRASLAYTQAVSEEALDRARRDWIVATQEQRDREEIRNLWLAYAGATWVAAGLEAWLLTADPTLTSSQEHHYLVDLPRTSPWGAAVRSALVPGSGHRHLGRSGRGNVYSAAFALSAGAAILAQESFLDARRDQLRAQDEYDQAQTEVELDRARDALRAAADDTDEKDTIRHALVGVTAGIWLWSVVDAFFAGSGDGSSAFAWTVVPGEELVAAASWSFP